MQKLKKLKHIFVVLVLSLSVVFGSIFLFSGDFSNAINGFFIYRTGNNTWQDRIYAHTIRPSSDIAIIRIDNKSINALQAKGGLKMLTIPKINYITLIEKLEAAGVKGIAFDIIFENADKDEELFAKTMSKYKNIVIASNLDEKICVQQFDLFLRSNYDRSIVSGEKRVVATIDTEGLLDPSYQTSQLACAKSFIKILQKNFAILDPKEIKKYEWVKDIDVDKSWKAEYASKLLCEKSIDTVYENCPGVPRSVYAGVPWGIVNVNDLTGYARKTNGSIDSMPYAYWLTGTGKTYKPNDLILDTLPLALYTQTQESITEPYIMLLRDYKLNPHFGGKNTYPSFSFIDSVDMGKLSALKTFKGKYVFIGESGTATHDVMDSPVNGDLIDGVEVHAHYLDGLLQDKMLGYMSDDYYFTLLAGLTIFMILLYFLLPGFLSLFIAIAIIFAIIYGTRYSYDVDRILIDIFPLLLAGSIVTFPITFIYKFFVVDREKRQLKNNFAHYIDPRVVDEIASKGDSIELGGERRTLSVLFSDIAGFTTISEKLDPRDLFYLMTAYLSNMTDILIKQGGTLDKYIGDAVMGFFGAPKFYEDHAVRSANTALLMQKALPLFNGEIQKHGIDEIGFRVGIASGEVLVGNIGSHNRFNYTVLGDTVNLASRLEGTGKEYGVSIIISHTTKEALNSNFFVRELDTIAVKGKTEGVRIYELVGYSLEFVERTKYTVYERALGLYRAGDYREAGKLWQSQAELDPPSRVMMLRCAEVLQGNLKVNNGVFIMNHK